MISQPGVLQITIIRTYLFQFVKKSNQYVDWASELELVISSKNYETHYDIRYQLVYDGSFYCLLEEEKLWRCEVLWMYMVNIFTEYKTKSYFFFELALLVIFMDSSEWTFHSLVAW